MVSRRLLQNKNEYECTGAREMLRWDLQAPSYTLVRPATTPAPGAAATLSLRARGSGLAGRLRVLDKSEAVCVGATADGRRVDTDPERYNPGTSSDVGGCGWGSGLRRGDTGERLCPTYVAELTASGSGTGDNESDVVDDLLGGGTGERRAAAGLVGRPRGIWDRRMGDVRGEPSAGMAGSRLMPGLVGDSA